MSRMFVCMPYLCWPKTAHAPATMAQTNMKKKPAKKPAAAKPFRCKGIDIPIGYTEPIDDGRSLGPLDSRFHENPPDPMPIYRHNGCRQQALPRLWYCTKCLLRLYPELSRRNKDDL